MYVSICEYVHSFKGSLLIRSLTYFVTTPQRSLECKAAWIVTTLVAWNTAENFLLPPTNAAFALHQQEILLELTYIRCLLHYMSALALPCVCVGVCCARVSHCEFQSYPVADSKLNIIKLWGYRYCTYSTGTYMFQV